MKRISFITVVCILGFLFQFFLFNLLGPWATPHFVILCVVFFDLYWGVRYSLYAAFLGGFLLDVFSLDVIGSHVLALMLCAYITIFVRLHFYQPGSYLSRALVVGVSVLAYGFILGVLSMINDGNFSLGGIVYALAPEFFITTLCANIIFEFLKKWAVRLTC